nr:PREDICTED: low molecular weight phosphotyrosine protein phosphatase-like isoform X3 [Saccoglossus kowalevskii]
MAATGKRSVLFVCLGNICRSPMAEAVFRSTVKQKGVESEWKIDSAATSTYEIGKLPDPRNLACLKKRGLSSTHRARQITQEDFTKFEYIFGMDNSNMQNINRVKPKNSTAKVELFGSYDPKGQLIIEDPYYGGDEGFEEVFEQVTRCSEGFLKKIYGKP